MTLKEHIEWRNENDIKLLFPLDIYNKIYYQSSRQQRIDADWYLAELAIKAMRDKKEQQAFLLIDHFIKDELV